MSGITYRRLVRADLARISEIDRTERIDTLYVQRGARLEQRLGDFQCLGMVRRRGGRALGRSPARECERHLAAGGIGLRAFANGRLVGIGIVRPHIRPGIAQFAFLYVSSEHRAQGIGPHPGQELERLARELGIRR